MKDLSMHILDICQNCVAAKATEVTIIIHENMKDNQLSIEIGDNGCGMSAAFLSEVRDPFKTSRTTRKVGLGIPLLEQTCIQTDGVLELESVEGQGTTIRATMTYDHIDRPPFGDLVSTIHLFIIMNEDLNVVYRHVHDGKEYVLDTAEVKAVLDGVSFNEIEVSSWIKEHIRFGLEEIGFENQGY